LAQHELVLDHPAVALALGDRAAARLPDFAAAWLVKVRALEALGDKVASFRAAEAAFTRLHGRAHVAREAVAAAAPADRVAEAMARARMALSLRFDDTDTRTGSPRCSPT
jgi:hypothetical protein